MKGKQTHNYWGLTHQNFLVREANILICNSIVGTRLTLGQTFAFVTNTLAFYSKKIFTTLGKNKNFAEPTTPPVPSVIKLFTVVIYEFL